LWNDEPTDEQLQVIMRKVANEARRESEEIVKNCFKALSASLAVPSPSFKLN